MKPATTRACLDCGDPVGNLRYAEYCQECRAQRKRKKYVWQPTPEIDQAIRDAWQSKAHGVKAYRVVQIRTKCDWPKWKICIRAVELGVARRYPKERRWSPEELEVLKRHAWRHPTGIKKKLRQLCDSSRTLVSIMLKRRRLELLGNHHDFYSLNYVSKILGVDQHKIRAWVEWGWLEARRRGTDRTDQQGGDMFAVYPKDLRAFLVAHADQIDLAKVEKWPFLELITNGKIQLLDEVWRRPSPPAAHGSRLTAHEEVACA